MSLQRPKVEIKTEDHGDYMRLNCYHLISFFPDIDGHKKFTMPGKQLSQHFPAEYRYPPLKTTTEEIGSQASLGVLGSDMTEEDFIITKMASSNRRANVELVRLVR